MQWEVLAAEILARIWVLMAVILAEAAAVALVALVALADLEALTDLAAEAAAVAAVVLTAVSLVIYWVPLLRYLLIRS